MADAARPPASPGTISLHCHKQNQRLKSPRPTTKIAITKAGAHAPIPTTSKAFEGGRTHDQTEVQGQAAGMTTARATRSGAYYGGSQARDREMPAATFFRVSSATSQHVMATARGIGAESRIVDGRHDDPSMTAASKNPVAKFRLRCL
ncbi:hypothetical protein [Bradyrhizobium sp. DOA9]|uniref:hypothetical protein n=1 Tax=Bradyrhizobium sp. DOA9 TaxID=1126627 RepID=UPI0007236DE0|nr:hypothetical protein [Bradyrhizobium sp. DOA9]GAJ31687.1 hypothetical protein BDOA9_0108690 [Bradyrhizobium sp. DOA9]